ncbi:CHASE4 domain-containing protein, partial [Klebsiella michiganensis]|nr:diguanylate cyclase [Klebsiella michiganensis]
MKLLSEEGLNNGARTLLKNHLLVMLLVLVGGFMISFATLLYVSNELDYRDDVRSKALLSKAFNFRQDAIRTQLSDYADWGDTYRNLHQQLNMEWAWQKQNLGRSLYNNFGYEGVFLVTSDGKTRYSVSEGRLVTQSLEKWLGKDIFPEILAALRQSGGKAVSLFVISDQQ